jgi:hypothetical protein
MLSVTMHKDIGEYKPKVAFGLSARMIISVTGAIGLAVAIGFYCTYVLGISIDDALIFVYLSCIPFWCVGFIRPKQMAFEKFLPLFIRHQMTDNRIFYVSSAKKFLDSLKDEGKDTLSAKSKRNNRKNHYAKFRQLNGIERWEPGNE